MTEIRGRLLFTGWFNRPWPVVQQDGETVDLYPPIEAVLARLAGKPAAHDRSPGDAYEFGADAESPFDLQYEPDKIVWLQNRDEFGGSNVHAYLDSTLGWLTGRVVICTIEDLFFRICPDPTVGVFTTKFFGRGNMARIPDGVERTVCKVGERDCCIFLVCGAVGFECAKFSNGMARTLLDRHHKGEMRASRIGDCALSGREKEA